MNGPRVRAVPKARLRQKESPLVTAILKALKLKGVFAWRVNAGLTVFKAQAGHARRVVKGAEAGTPDILLVLPTDSYWIKGTDTTWSSSPMRLGVLHGIEVKTETGRLSASQLAWHANAERHGVRVGVARSIGEALELVKKWSGKS